MPLGHGLSSIALALNASISSDEHNYFEKIPVIIAESIQESSLGFLSIRIE